MRALLKGIADARQPARRDDALVQMIGRTGRGLVTVQLGARTFSVDAFRLCLPHDRTRRIAATDLAALPWNGKGPDPMQAAYQAAMKSEATAPAPPAHQGAAGGEPAHQGTTGSPPAHRDTAASHPAASHTGDLTLRSPAERGVSKGRHAHTTSPSFETAVSRPPQDEDGTAIARRA